MSSWLAKRTGIHINLRPLARPVGAIAGGLVGGPAGAALGAGLFGAGDDLGHGKNIGQAALGGLKTGAETYAGAKLLPMLGEKLGFGGGGDAAAAGGGAGGAPGAAAPMAADPADLGMDGMGGMPGAAAPPPPTGSLARRALSSVGGFIKQNPVASLNAAGTAASTYANTASQNADRRLYRDQVARSNSLEDQERERRQSIGTAWLEAMKKSGNPMALQLAQQLGYA